MVSNKIYRTIYKKIKKYNNIIIARHVGADPDALASQIALRNIIQNTFPNKHVLAVGCPASKFKYLGMLDKIDEEDYEKSLLIVLDVPDKARVDGVDVDKVSHSIKIDHHPFVEKFCDFEWIDDEASSTSQMIVELVFNSKLKITKESAEKLYIGIVADTNRFLFYYTTPKTFNLVSKLIQDTGINFTNLYELLYLRSLSEMKFQSYIINNMVVTDNGFGYIKIDQDILKEYNMDAATAGNMVNNFNYIEEIIAWAVFSYDAKNENIRGSIRSRGPIVNETASLYNGGGHNYASGVRLKNFDEVDKLVKDLDSVCKKYNEE